MLPYPPCTVDAYTIYSIADDKELREKVTYNGELDQFEIPISELNRRGRLAPMVSYPQKIEGTSIIYYVDKNDNFCFRIE